MNIKPQHPRLLVDESTWSGLRSRREKSPTLDQLLHVLERDARALLDQPVLTREKIGVRLLFVSREALKRILLWSLAYHTTDAKELARRAQEEMLAIADFSDWNPSHFLDVAEMTLGFALGYDWLYDQLDPDARTKIRHAIVEKGLKPGLDSAAQFNWWYNIANNWNQVCLCGLTLGALAIAKDEPELARQYVERAIEFNPVGLKPYAPDGVYPEGPIYWGYGTSFQVVLLAGLESALGTDFGPGRIARIPRHGRVPARGYRADRSHLQLRRRRIDRPDGRRAVLVRTENRPR